MKNVRVPEITESDEFGKLRRFAIIDGWHRVTALRRLRAENPTFNEMPKVFKTAFVIIINSFHIYMLKVVI